MNDAGASSLPAAGSKDGPPGSRDPRTASWQLATEAAGIGIFDWNLDTGEVRPDDRLRSLLGVEPGDDVLRVDELLERVHPDDKRLLDRAATGARKAGADYRVEFRVFVPGGERRWLAARGRTAIGPDGAARLVGAAYDVTDVRSERDRAAHALATMSSGYLSLDAGWRVRYLNVEAERVLGRTLEELRDRNFWEAFPGAEERAFGHHCPLAMSSGEVVSFEEYYPELRTWFEVRAVPSEDGLEVYFLDITQRRRAQDAARTAAERLELLADVSGRLATTLDAEEAVAQLTRLMVPALASWCLVTIKNDDGSLRDIAWWHEDPDRRPLVEEYAAERMAALTDTSFVARALRTGQPQIVRDATPSIQAVLSTPRARDLLGALAPEHAMVLPLTARGRTVGLLSLFLDAERGPLDPNDVVTAREVAVRAGLALDNARLYRQQADLAEGLQRSLLTDPPVVEGLDIVVRYQPAAQVAAVGGDWYDAFQQPDGTTALVIGDVVGHDTEAAAAMGQLRGLLRGIAYRTGTDPAAVLTGLDAAMEALTDSTTATAIVALLPGPDGRGRCLRWSNAGHPPPMLLRPDGSVTALPSATPDLLLGFDPETPRATSEFDADPGMTFLLYTDGLVERRGQSIDEGLALLQREVTELGRSGVSLETMCDELLRRLLPPAPEDDVALVAVRIAR